VRNNGSHALYMLMHLFGPIAELVADDAQILKQWLFPDGDIIIPETNDYANAIMTFASGLTISMQISWSLPLHQGWMIDVYGQKGRLVASSPTFPTARDCVLRGGQLGGTLAEIAIDDCYRAMPGIGVDWQAEVQPAFPMALSMAAMVRAIHGEGKASPDFARALEIERVQEAIRVSSAERRWVKLNEIG
jgi:predicted dehydrogenase